MPDEAPKGQLDDVLKRLQSFKGLDSEGIDRLLEENADALPQDLYSIEREAEEKLAAEFKDVLTAVQSFLAAVQQVRDNRSTETAAEAEEPDSKKKEDEAAEPEAAAPEELVKEWLEVKGASSEATSEAVPESEEAKVERLSKQIIDAWKKTRDGKGMAIYTDYFFKEMQSNLGEKYVFLVDRTFDYAVIEKDGYSFLVPNPCTIGIKDFIRSHYKIVDLGDNACLSSNAELLKLAYCKTEDYKRENSEFVKGLIDNKTPEVEFKRVALEAIKELEGNAVPDDFDARKEFEEAMKPVTSEKMWAVLRNFQVDDSEEDVGKIVISLMHNIMELSEKDKSLWKDQLKWSQMVFDGGIRTCDRDKLGGLVDHLRKINDESPECSKAMLAFIKLLLRLGIKTS